MYVIMSRLHYMNGTVIGSRRTIFFTAVILGTITCSILSTYQTDITTIYLNRPPLMVGDRGGGLY